jgi:hypothetical protein
VLLLDGFIACTCRNLCLTAKIWIFRGEHNFLAPSEGQRPPFYRDFAFQNLRFPCDCAGWPEK